MYTIVYIVYSVNLQYVYCCLHLYTNMIAQLYIQYNFHYIEYKKKDKKFT